MKSLLPCILCATLPLFAEKPSPSSLEFTKWTPDFQVPDPVALSFDHQGRAYVTQTQRRKANDLDIRNNRDWIPDDLSFQSSEDKRAFYLKNFTSENSEANKARLKDFNNDGLHDLADLQMLSERIHLIEDTDGDGLADKTAIYAEDFTNEIAGIAAGVLHHDGDVYTTIVPDLWKLRDTDHDGKADTRESIAHGFGVHLAYAGHDMHGLTVGPDGRIYWTIGDKGLNVTSKEGHNFKYPNQGALLRCDPDGSNFEVYARGLRNVQEIAFDQFGNIFSVDNDSDRPGEKERFMSIVQHMDAGWRSNWQYRNGVYNPWMDENLSIPYHEGQPAYILPAISLYENGPAGFAFNPGTALNEDWKDYFFLTSAPNGQQWAFQIEPNGASYKMINDMQIGNGVPIVGINFSPDGALYGVDWGNGYPLNQKGAVWKWDVKNKHPLRQDTAKKLRSDFSKTSVARLVKNLEHPDQRIRLKAQFELVKQGLKNDLEVAATHSTQLGKIHAVWGLGQLNRKKQTPDFTHLLGLLCDPDAENRTQIIKIVGEHFGTQLALHQAPIPSEETSSIAETLVPFLSDQFDRVKFHTAIALGNIGSSSGAPPILSFAKTIRPEDTYLRHAAIVGLTGCASSDFLKKLSTDDSELIQKIAVVSLRRRADPAVASFLKSPFEHVVTEAALAIHDDWTIPAALPALAASLETTSFTKNESLIRRAINTNFHLGTPEAAQRVATFAARLDISLALRLEALDALSTWTTPNELDRVIGRHRPIKPRLPSIAKDATSAHLRSLLGDANLKIQTSAMRLALSCNIEIPVKSLNTILRNKGLLPELRIEAMRGLAEQDHLQLELNLPSALGDSEVTIRIEALKHLAAFDSTKALQAAESILQAPEENFFEKQAVVALLTTDLASEEGDQILSDTINTIDPFLAGIQLDLAEAAATRKLKAPAPDFSHTLTGGDSTRGKEIFNNHLAAQCVRCHKVDKKKGGSNIGPNLKSIGLTRDRASLLESLIDPQKVISQGYGTISVTLNDGSSVAGQFRREKNKLLEIADAEGKITKVKTSDIKDRSPIVSTMPPMGHILTKREVRDILEYLTTLKAK